MPSLKRIGVGLIGAGFIARTRMRCYAQVSGYHADMVAVAARTDASAQKFAQEYGIAQAFGDYRTLLAQPDIDVVDVCVPNLLHREIVVAAAQAGKHVICTKPLTAYVGQDLPPDLSAAQTPRDDMLRQALAEADAMNKAAQESGVQLMYGENWLYAPSIVRAEGLMRKSGGAILEMRGGESHSGSHSPYSKLWRNTGGGALIRLGAHPIGTMLHLKAQEGIARDGQPIRPVAVSAEVGDTSIIAAQPKIATGWEDVENWASAIITFADGAHGIVYASDGVLGGMESKLEIFLSNSQFKCNLSPNDLLQTYAPDAAVFGDAYIMEKIDGGAGWTTPIPDEDWSSGHAAMIQDFVAALGENRPAKADGQLGRAVLEVVYAAYLAAESGRRIELSGNP
ncbi:MAG: gfo/Idh/MocA family oxidoreductase [Chloroflexi bacterium]|nr:gfo/Idh/MocA family oxidoreductase [Chloroflexota bacterium]